MYYMVWTKIRIDFTETVQCEFCSRKITSGKGIVIKNENGDISFSGPNCAQNRNGKNVSNPNEKIVDITKGCILQELMPIRSDRGMATVNIRIDEDNFTQLNDIDVHNYHDINAVKAYFTLRFEKLGHINAIPKAKKLVEIYNTYISEGKILNKDESYIKMIMYGDKYPRYSYKNLQSVYAADYWLVLFIENNNGKDLTFIESTLHHLRTKLFLTKKQIIGINNWFSHSEGRKVKLKENAFE